MFTRTKKLLELSKNYSAHNISAGSANTSVSTNPDSEYSGPGYIETLSPNEFQSSGSEYVPSINESNSSISTFNSSVEVEIENDLLADMVNVYNEHVIKQNGLKTNITSQTKPTNSNGNEFELTNCEVESFRINVDQHANVEKSIQQKNEDLCNSNHITNNTERYKRVRNKGHICYFCNKQIINMARHLATMHNQEVEVAKILSYPKNSKSRKELFEKIMKAGDFYHNCNVIELKQVELVLVRRPGENQTNLVYTEYGSCPNCLGFFLKKRLSLHYRTSKPNAKSDAKVISQSNALMACTQQRFSTTFIKDIKDALRDDDIGQICKNDDLILRYGYMNYEKFGNSQNELILQYMRQLARLLKEARICDRSITNFDSLLKTQKFDVVIDAVKSLCQKFNDFNARPEFAIPSLALKIGHGIRKCIGIARGTCLRNGSITRDKELVNYLALLDLEWASRISSAALATLSNRKFNAG
ncbi:hypothetical protein FQR65_LT17930 [Abscondita terminalis]|nr:hypothetical protein FQR65_LT17930 [Abscondita terminalis]